jgi:AAA+ ATPase superfamily predicted ATPase
VVERVLNRLGPLFNEPRTVLGQELATPHSYFSILAVLAEGAASWNDVLARSGVDANSLGKYLGVLIKLRIVEGRLPVTETSREARRRQYQIRDGFLRFWFRFVFPLQTELEEGLDPTEVYRTEIEPHLREFIGPIFEDLARAWVRRRASPGVRRVGPWWGPAVHSLRRTGARTSEEIDIVALSGRTVTLVGECRWRRDPMDVMILKELEEFKLPALAQVPGVTVAPDCRIVLFSRGGFTTGLREAAARIGVQLVTPEDVVDGLRSGPV